MGKHRNVETGMVVSVDDSKDDRYKSQLFEPYSDADAKKDAQARASGKPPAKKSADTK